MMKDMILHTRNEESVRLGRTRVFLRAYCSAHWGVLRTILLLLMMTVGVNGSWGQTAPVEITTDADGNGTIEDSEKKFYLIQTNAFQSFYIAPQANNTITTNNILGDYMLWYFLDAGEDGGTQYYYIVNNSTGKYVSHADGSANNDTKRAVPLVVKDQSNDESCKFKFDLNESKGAGFYNIKVKGSQTYYALNKRGGSMVNTKPIQLTNNQYINDIHSLWKFIPFNGTFTKPDPPFTPFTPSDDSEKHYYEIHNVQRNTYYASTDATPDKVIFTKQASESRAWYFQEASSDTWYKYYYIINPSTGGKYMYYEGTAENTSDQTDAVSVKAYDSANEERYQFVVVQAARGDGNDRVTCYAIIPKLLIDNLWTSNSLGLGQGSITDDAIMGIINSRGADNGAHWNFDPTLFTTVCAHPVINFDNTSGKVSLTTTTSWPSIYYTTDGTEPSSTNGTLYGEPFALTEQTTVKAIVTKDGYTDSEVTTLTINKVATPTIQQETGTHNISITTATLGATIYYTTDGTTPTTKSTPYNAPSEELAGKLIKAIAVKDGMINSDIGEGEVDIKCATPVISFNNVTSLVTITCGTAESTIYYTIDGSTPTSSSTEYGSPFSVTSPKTVKAIATHTTEEPSDVAELVISQVATPTIQNNGSNAISITTTPPDATIYFTTDGSIPTTSSEVYSSPLTDNVSNKTIKAIAVKENMITSAEGSGTVMLKCATPVITRNGLTFTLSCSLPTDATLSYTLGGGSEMTYSGTPVSFTTDQLPLTVTAVARHSDYTDSETASMILLNGTGTPTDPYLIYGTTDLNNFVTSVNNGIAGSSCYKLCFDVSASDMAAPINEVFSGTFDGGYHSISGLSRPLFNTITDGTVKNVVLDPNTTVNGNGAICNEADGSTKIYNCGVLSGTISGSGNVGGLVGHIASGSSVRVVNCYNFATVSGGTTMAGIVGNNEGTVGDVRIALCMMYGNMPGGTSPVYAGNHTSNVSNFNEYNYWRSKADLSYSAYNDQLAIDKDEYLTRFPFYRHILNSHRELAAYFLFGDYTTEHVNEIGHWAIDNSKAIYPIVERWETNTKKVLDAPAGSTVSVRKGDGSPITSLNVTVKIGANEYSASLPITDMDEANHDYTWGKVVLPFANEFEKNTDYSKICTGWKITSITGGTEGNSFDKYDVSDRDCTSKDLYSTTGFVFAQGGNYIVPYNVTDIEITANFATAYYLRDEAYDIGYSGDKTGNNVSGYTGRTSLGGSTITTPNTYQGETVYNTLKAALTAMSASGSTHSQAVVLVGNYHQDDEDLSSLTSKGLTIMSIDADNNQEPDYAWYSNNTQDRPAIPPTRFDFVALIPVGMSSRVNNSTFYPGIPIWKPRGWFEMTETSLSKMDQFELNSNNFNDITDKRNYRCIINGGYFTQMVRSRKSACNKVKYYQIGGNAYVKEFYPGSHSADNYGTVLCPINVTGGEIEQCFMTGYGKGTAIGPDIYFWCAGGKIDKFLGAYMEKPRQTSSSDGNVNMTAKIDHAKIGRFFGGGTSPKAQISGNIDVTINNSTVDFYCGGPEFGDMSNGKTVSTHAKGTTFGEYYGAGFGGTAITYTNDEDNNGQGLGTTSKPTVTYPSSFFTSHFVAERLKNTTNGIGSCYKFEFIFNSRGSGSVARFYTGYAKFSLATTGSVTNVLDGCTMLGDFYGAGCQGKVNGTVSSTLTGCAVNGSAFGGGYKAENNIVDVYPKTAPTMSVYTRQTGIFSDFGTVAPVQFVWKQNETGHAAGTSVDADSDGKGGILYTDVTLSELGNVTGAIDLTVDGGTVAHDVFGGGNESKSLDNTSVTIQNGASISGDVFGAGKGKADDETVAYVTGGTTVSMIGGTVSKSVYGGGQLAQVGGDTQITVSGGNVGVANAQSYGATVGNVYGGGMGNTSSVAAGLIKGNTEIEISGGTIYHNIYGGGAYGSVGEFDYDTTTGLPTSRKANTTGGTANVTITGGTIGTTGKNNGMVFGSSRGDVAEPGAIHDRLAWVHDTHVIIGTTGQGTDAPQPQIKGSVYGSGENGHTYQNTIVDIHSGTIGINNNETVTYKDDADDENKITYTGKDYNYPYRGNVYGGGCGTDKYYANPTGITNPYDGNGDTYNPLAGIVQGIATVNIDGGLVVHNVYGAGAMGSVGTMTKDNDGAVTITSGGTTTIRISGGTVGVDGSVDVNGNGNGNVFGAARGDAATTQTDVALVKTTGVTISGTTSGTNIKGSVYGGGEVGNVGTYTTDDDDNNNYPEGSGVCNVSITGGTIWNHVFGAGKGAGVTFKCEKAMVSTTSVSMSAGTVKGNVYGGGEVGRVEHNTLVTIGTESGGETLTINGSVFGAGKGLATHGYSALVRGNPTVIVQGSANVGKSVYGGGEIASVGKYGLDAKKMPSILKGGGECLVTVKGGAHIGTDGEGDVFGAGRGVETPFTLGESKRMTMYTNSTDFPAVEENTTWERYETGSPFVWEYFQDKTAYSKYLETLALVTAPTVNIEGSANVNGSVYGGGEKGITKGTVVVNIKGGTIQKDVYGGGALADTNTGNWSPNKYVEATLPEDASETLYTRTGEAEPYVYTVVDPKDVTNSGTYYKTVGAWTNATATAWKTTTVNLTGGTIIGDAYGGGLGQIARAASEGVTALDDIKAYVWGDVKVELNNNNNGETADGTQKGCIVSRIFGCNNQNGTPKGKVQVYVYATQNKNKPDNSETQIINAKFPLHDGAETGATSTYDVAAVYGGGNLSPYEPADDDGKTEVYIYGCDLTSIKQVYGGGNAACAPATLVHVTGAYEIEELFGGGNGYDDYELYDKYYKNPGANVGYRNYSVLDDTGDGSQGNPYGCEDANGTSTLEGRQTYAYGTGIATTEIIGGKIHFVYGGSNKKGNIRVRAKSVYEELDETCPIVTDETYGGGKDSPMDGMVDMGLGCVNNMEQTFGGSKNADVNSDIYLRITNGTYKQVFGGNNTSGAINGSITVEIKEEGCSPVRIEELYLGGYLAPYSVYGYETENGSYKTEPVPYIDADGNQQQLDQRIPKTSGDRKKDPRIYVISATRIDNIFGGGYQAKVVGNPHVNVNMEKGKIKAQYVDANFVNEHSDSRPYYAWTGESVDETSGDGILPIGTIGNIYGGGNMANIIGNTHVEIGTGYWHNEDDVLETETIGEDGKSYTYIYSESTKKWSCEVTTGEEGNQTTQTLTSDKAPVPARNAATITGNVFGGGKGKADTYECEKAMVGVSDGLDNSIGNTSVIIANGTVGPVDANNKVGRQVDDNGIVIGGNVYGGGEVGRVEYNTTVTIGLNPDEIDETSGKYVPIIGGDVFGAGAGVETHGYSALVRGDAEVTVQAHAKVNGSVYGGGEKATVGKYWVKGVPYPGLNPPNPPSDDILPDFMPYAPRAGGICRVTVKDYAEIGDGTTGGHVFGAGKGVEPHWVYGDNTIEKKYWSRRMSKYDSKDYNSSNQSLWEYTDNTQKFVWEYFDTEKKYATFLETLALASETHVTIGETSGSETVTINGSVYGGSENGFVQTDTDVDILSTSEIGANVFGGGKGTETHDAAGRVKGNSNVAISGGAIAGNVYGGGELGHVGTFTEKDGKYVMQTIKDKEGHDMNTGLCTVTIAGGKIGPDNNTDKEKGNVFGAGKGKDDTFKCEKAMTMNTNVSISAGTVNGNVYGGGEIGRVENDTEVTIGRKSGETEGNGTGTPTINGSVFGAGRGVATHGYSALVRGNTQVTVEGAQGSTVTESVYGGGEIASVGRYGLDAEKMPEILVDGGICTVKILGYATIGPANATDDKGNVFGAGKGVNPQTFKNTGDDKSKLSRRMTLYTNNNDFPDSNGTPTPTLTGSTWEYYETGSPYVWEYYQSVSAYSKYLETLALATQPHVTIGGNATVNGSVFGGGELGITKGSVYVNVLSGTIVKDVYGGGSLANTNTTSTWSLRDSEGKPVAPVNGVYTPDPTPVHPKTTVNLLGGKLRYAYGGGLGQLERAADAVNNITALTDIPAKVFGNVKVNLNGLETEDYDEDIHQNYAQAYKETSESPVSYYKLKNTRNSSGVITSYATGAVVKQIFGCNNLNGSPQKHVKVHVFATQNADASHNTIGLKYPVPTEENNVTSSVYDVEAVYGGGNLAPYEPEGGATTTESTEVIIEGCDLTSIKQVYGGGNAASAPATKVTINSAYEIEEVFGGGNGLDSYVSYGKTYQNPGANVGYKNYTTFEWNGNKNLYEVVVNDDADTKEERLHSTYVYGTGEASVNIYGGRIHRIFGGSNTLGNVRKTAVTVLDSQDPCLLDIDEAYGGGKSASMDAEAKLIMACIPGLKAVYGGAQDADIQDDVVLTITNGTFNRVFGGNNVSGKIHGTITVNIEETGCKPVVIGQLYGGGNQAPYTAPWKDENDHSKGRKDGPTVNVKSFTSIGEVFGGGYGETAVVTGDPYVNVNVCEGKFAGTAFEENTQTISFSEYKRNKDGEGEESFVHNETTGERIMETKRISVLLPGHLANKIGAINNIFGGGNAAKVIGNTHVKIGTSETETFESVKDDPATTENEKVKAVVGVDVRGNVYGGGNQAEVTGDTNVVIGKETTTTP